MSESSVSVREWAAAAVIAAGLCVMVFVSYDRGWKACERRFSRYRATPMNCTHAPIREQAVATRPAEVK